MTARVHITAPLSAALCAWMLLLTGTAPAQNQPASKRSVTATVTSPRQRVFENEVFTLTLSITADGVQLGQAIDYLPGSEGDALKLGPFEELPDKTELHDGVVRRVRRFRVEARALQRGPMRVSPRLTVRLVERKRALIGSMWQETQQRLQAKPLDLMVLPVPTRDRPADWSSAIGQYSFRAMASPRNVAAGDLVTVRTVVRGKGYRENMSPPRLSPGRRFKAYDPKQISDDGNEVVFEQIVIPQSTNALSIPAVTFCFFDPIADAYKTVRQGPFALTYRKKTVKQAPVFRPSESTVSTAAATSEAAGRNRESVRRIVLILAAGLAFALLAVGITRLVQRRRAPAAWAIGAAAGLALTALWVSRSAAFAIEPARVGTETVARFAPTDASMPLFTVGKGGTVRVMETAGPWVRIRHDADSGWVPASSLQGW